MKNALYQTAVLPYLITAILLLSLTNSIAQKATAPLPATVFSSGNNTGALQDPFGIAGRFIQNVGQYGEQLEGFGEMGKIQYGYEGMGMPVLFTSKGFIQLQRKKPEMDEEERERLEKKGVKPESILEKLIPEDRCITVEWLNANPHPLIIAEEKTSEYHTYGKLAQKANAYKKLIYKNVYPGIDIVYLFVANDQPGFEYRIILHPGADLSVVKMKLGGDTKKIKSNSKGLLIKTDIDGITQTAPVSFYEAEEQKKVAIKFDLHNNIVDFITAEMVDRNRTLIIDPFVTGTTNLTGLNAGKAKDVDFDYAGNVYITGGGSYTTTHSLAKYDAAGVLQWTFNGSLTIPSWTFGTYYGGWMVEKPTGNIYLGQGFNFSTGFQVIRVSTTGLYDNYITTANQSFTEAWKMYWNCNNGSPQILIAGGGINSDINFGIFAPPSTTVTSLNVTGIPYTGGGGWAQDIADFVFDPANNDMYSIYGSLIGTPALGNQLYKNTAPYSSASIAWNVPSGLTTVSEAANRPYLVAGGLVDNSANMLYVNAAYLYYWDGKNLKAFNKATGAGVGTVLTTANTPFAQGGIVVDACNNVFVGEANGNIKVYQFNGSTFNDAAAADITIPGFAGRHVYDLAYDEAKKLLYASGDGFVASFDISAYCPNTFYTISVIPNCTTNTATATVSPAPPAGSTVTYTLYTGGVQIASNTTGIFTGINPNTSYSIIATINLPCSGSQASATFTIPAPTLSTTQTNTTCGAGTGTITATGSGTAGPFTYNINGGAFQASGSFTGLTAGIYTIIVKDAGGCPNTKLVTITNSNGPALSFTQTNADCGSNNGTITATATGGTSPYQYSIDNGVTYQTSNFFTGLMAGQYTLKVKDAGGCTNASMITITSSLSALITAIPAAATCGNNNGSITAFGSSGTPPLQYSINGNLFQAGNIFNNLTPGAYTVTVKDANGCISSTAVTIGNTAAPTVTATSTPAACSNINGSITAAGNGGVAPLQYSINNGAFSSNSIFTGLAAGVYTIAVKDFTGCTSTISVTVASTNGPTASAIASAASCNASNGSITASGTGTGPFQYSLDGFTFQGSNVFSGLPAGTYIVYVRDGLGCMAATSVIISNIAGPSVTAVSTAASCNSNDGTITATGTAGTLPYQYSIDGFTFQAGNIFTGLAPNNIYTVTIRDGAGCEQTTTVTVNNASGLALTVSTIAASCNNSIGVITATATGGTGLLQYSINGTVYQAGNVFNGLAAGGYTVYVKDGNGCIVTSAATIDAISSATLTVTTTDETCNSANGIIEILGSGGVAPLTYSIDGITYQASGTFFNIAAGNYTAYVKDGLGCVGTRDLTITNTGAGPGISTFTVTVKNAYLCNGSLGKITNPRVNGSNCGSCTFSLDGGAFIPNATQLFLNVAVGTHTLTAMDASGCTKTIILNMGIAVNSTASAVVTGTACNTSNGSIILTGIGPNTPYHVSMNGIGGPWITFDPSTTFTGLAAGTYTFILADDESFDSGPPIDPGGCLDTITVVVPSTGGPALSITQTNGTCALNDGSITALGSGGTPPLDYSIDGGALQSTGDFTGLGSGTYSVTVQDGTGCSTTKLVTIVNPTGPDVTGITSATSCGLNNGSITATGSGGTPPLQYSIDGFSFQAGNTFSNLASGAYSLYVKDANNCYNIIPLSIIAAPVPKVTAFTIATTCGNSNGSIIATGASGTAPYTYSLNGTVFQSSNIFNGLAAGFYTVTVKDDRGCISTTGINIGNIGAPTFTAVSVAAKCGNANGTITITATGGTGTYQYSKDGISFQAGNVLAGLSTGTYTVTVKDGNGCIATKAVLVGNINGPQTLTAVTIDAACGNANGRITATATGGTTPLQYSIDGVSYQVSNIFNAVTAGPYTLYVRDANLCIKTLPVTIANLSGPSIVLSASDATCGLNDGTITATATGGTVPLTYSKNGVTFQASDIFTGLAAGGYTITVKDGRGCINTATITVTTPGNTTPTFNPVAAICSGGVLAALPTASLNGITGAWSPALNNTSTTTYTFTPTAGQCATTTTLSITVNANVTPTFNPVAAICSGGVLTALPTTSLNGITGVWSPALNNTSTTTYTFTPTAGQCATATTLAITVNPNVTPTFNPVAAICSGGVLAALPTTSLNGITGTWSPALNNTSTTTYSCTPTAGQCATTTTLAITVNPNVTPTFNPVAAICSGGTLTALPTTSLNGITGVWSPTLNNTNTTTYTFTPTAGQCATTTTLAITVNPNVTPTFNPVAAICSGGVLAALPTTSLNGITGTWSPALNNTSTTTYTFTPTAGQCATTTTLAITVNPNVTPTFNPVAAICSGGVLTALPTTSLNGITGAWSPALNNTSTTTYTFTPTAGQCATTTTLAITVNPNVTPIYNPVAAICSGGVLTALPTTSLNGITGTWSPALNNTSTTTYTFTPTAGQCATTTTLAITVNPNVTPTFNPVAAICSGGVLTALPTTSLNGITGAWNPALNNTSTTTYTFTPSAGQCATATTLAITVNANVTPTFNPVAAICSGGVLTALPTTSLNGITGTWSPALNNTNTTTYTFTPTAGQCATTTTLAITVNPNITPTFNPVAAICSGGVLTALPTTSLNGITGTWSPALNNTTTTTYTFTPTAGQCATTTTLAITINPNVTPTFNSVAAICSGGVLTALPTTSLNGITGTWSPALNNTSTTTYTFTPTVGQCATTTTLAITVNANVTPTFNPVAAICSGGVLAALPTTSLNGITGTWSPALNNTTTTTYTFTPTAGQCPTTTTLTITINPILSPTINCGISTTSSVSFTWAIVSDATDYIVSYQINSGPLFNVGTIGNVLSYSVNGLTGGDNVSITVLPVGASGTCFTSSSTSCTATACTPPTATISYSGSPFCVNLATSQTVTLTGTGIFTVGIYSAPSGLSINTATGTILPSTSTAGTYTITYTVAGSGDCAGVVATTSVTINTLTTPAFNSINPICSGGVLAALPTTSLNGITGTWSPALNNTSTTTYTFTPTAGQCATTTTLAITVNPNVTPTFNPVAAICSGGILSALPTTSLNGITGTWSPALNNTSTTTYTFTPTAGQCATTTTLAITVNANVTPTFNPVAAICSGGVLSALPTTSLNGITGAWSPALNNTTTTTYTFTPTAGQCATTTTLTITINPILSPTINCGISTTSSVSFTWATVSGATDYIVSYQVDVNPVVTIGSIGNVLNYQVNGLSSGDNVSIRVTPASLTGTCFSAAVASCTATACTPPTASISYATPFCVNDISLQPVTLTGTGVFTGGIFSAAAGLTINSLTGAITAATSTPGIYSISYSIAPSGGCQGVTANTTVTINDTVTPTFTAVAAICAGDPLTALPTISLNGINGAWSPALNNTTTTIYTFTPAAGQCAGSSSMLITVNPSTTPVFNTIGALCQNSTPPSLQNISNNGISGTWNPATINTASIGTTTYAFTPAAGQCAAPATLNVTIATQIVPVFTTPGPLCLNAAAPALPATSNNGITGTWNPANINTSTTGTTTYTFTPNAGQCAAAAVTMDIVVTNLLTPSFNPVAAICSGETLSPLATTSLNGINGSWSPALNNTATTTYTFTPTVAQCAAIATLTITVNTNVTPTFNPIAAICSGGILSALPTTSLNGITGSWSPALNNTTTTTYTFTPAAGQCATTTTLVITVNPNVTPTFNPVAAICSGQPLAALPTTSLNGITGSWSPALNNATTTIYTFTPVAGQCAASTTLTITVNQKTIPTFNAAPAICFGDALPPLPTTSLNGINGSWSPALNNTTTTIYTFTPTTGQCAVASTIEIIVHPKPVVYAGRDTTVSINQALTLNAVDVNQTGISSYLWSPPDGLSNRFVQNPVAVLTNDITYTVTATTINGCEATDAVSIRIDRTAEIYVPTAFSPGGNVNTILHAIPIGIKTFKYFAIYNRYGQEVFKTNNPAIGWDGKFKGLPQNSAGFVWIAEGIDYRNRVISRKGNVVLVR